MGLFKKTQTIERQTIKCPLCNKEHQIISYDYQDLYLNGMPKIPLTTMMASMTICTQCGIIYSTTNNAFLLRQILSTTEYQNILQKAYSSDTEKKLMLWAQASQIEEIHLYLAQMHRENHDAHKEQKELQLAIDAILTGKDTNKYHVNGADMPHFRDAGLFLLTPDVRLIDLYRRTQQWEKALEQVNLVRNMEYMIPPYTLFAYLKCQEKLIHKKQDALL